MQSIYEAANEQSSAETLFSIENTPENTAYFLLDYKNIDTLEPLGKLIMEIDVDTLLNAGDLTELYPNTCLALSDGEGKLLYGEGEDLQELLEQTEDNSSYLQGTAPGWQGRFYHVSQRVDDEERGWIFLYHFRPCTIWFGRELDFLSPVYRDCLC